MTNTQLSFLTEANEADKVSRKRGKLYFNGLGQPLPWEDHDPDSTKSTNVHENS